MALPIWAVLAIAVAVNVVAYALMPKPRTSTSRQAQDLREPTAEAGKPVPVAFGEITVLSPNVLYYGDISKHSYEVNA